MLAVTARPLTASTDTLDENVRGALSGKRMCAPSLHRARARLLRTLRQYWVHGTLIEERTLNTLSSPCWTASIRSKASSIRHYARRIATYRALELIRNTRTRTQKLGELSEEKVLHRRGGCLRRACVAAAEVLLHELLGSLSKVPRR